MTANITISYTKKVTLDRAKKLSCVLPMKIKKKLKKFINLRLTDMYNIVKYNRVPVLVCKKIKQKYLKY